MSFDDIFAAAPEPTVRPPELPPWIVVIADDDESVHRVTELALTGFRFENRPLKFVHAYSALQTLTVLTEHPETAVLLLDVVMESESAGLTAVRDIRENLGNRLVRIVLRTGQPGSAPETDVIARYDINDYKEKSELTSRKLYTLMFACLRGFRDLLAIERSRAGLARIVESAPAIFQLSSLEQFAQGALDQLAALSGADEGAVYGVARPARPATARPATAPPAAARPSGVAVERGSGDFRVLAATGRFSSAGGATVLPAEVESLIRSGRIGLHDGQLLELFPAGPDRERFLYLEGVAAESDLDRTLLTVFTRNLAIAFDNLRLKEEVEETQREIVFRLGEAVETRSQETGHHVKRVSEAAGMVAERLGLTPAEADRLRHAAPLHDVGKIGIPDAILNKPGSLTDEEWQVMRDHTLIGWRLLRDARQPILQLGAVIALQHHEKWNGSGYPHGLAGDAIDRFARIVAVVDVFDALGSQRPYKEPWPLPRIIAFIAAESGRHFDPAVAAAVLDLAPQLATLRSRWPDPLRSPPVGNSSGA
jgi:CheY-like chemotaxis protein